MENNETPTISLEGAPRYTYNVVDLEDNILGEFRTREEANNFINSDEESLGSRFIKCREAYLPFKVTQYKVEIVGEYGNILSRFKDEYGNEITSKIQLEKALNRAKEERKSHFYEITITSIKNRGDVVKRWDTGWRESKVVTSSKKDLDFDSWTKKRQEELISKELNGKESPAEGTVSWALLQLRFCCNPNGLVILTNGYMDPVSGLIIDDSGDLILDSEGDSITVSELIESLVKSDPGALLKYYYYPEDSPSSSITTVFEISDHLYSGNIWVL